MSKKVPRRQLVVELAEANARVIELANEVESWRDRHANAVRKMNAYRRTLDAFLEATKIGTIRVREIETWPTT